MKPRGDASQAKSPAAAQIDGRIQSLGDWRGRTLARIRELFRRADPEVVEEWKWVKPTSPGVPVWSHDGMICTGEVYKDKVKMTFASSLEGNVRRAIDILESNTLNEKALESLIRAAVARNSANVAAKRKPTAGKKAVAKRKR